MYINNKGLDYYNAKLLNRDIFPSSFEVDVFWSKNSLTPKIDKDIKRKYKKMIVGIEFKGTDSEIGINKSRLISDISISKIRFKTLNNSYDGYVVAIDNASKVKGYEVMSIEMNVLESENENIVEFKDDIKLILNNTETTPCVLELNPTMNLVDVKITGLGEDIIIKNLTKDKKIVIDGEKGLVIEDGLNKWKDYDSWSFPKLIPGENNININKASINAKLKYKARWI